MNDLSAPLTHILHSEALAVARGEPVGSLSTDGVAYLRGRLAHLAGQANLSIVFLQHAALNDPTDPAVFRDLGEALLNLDTASAIGAYLRSVALRATDPATHLGLSTAFRRLGDRRVANAFLQFALAFAPTSAEPHGPVCHALDGDSDDVVAHGLKSLLLTPDDPAAYRRLGNAYLNAADYRAALTIFRRGLRRLGAVCDLQVGVGQTLIRLGQMSDAKSAIDLALGMEPRNVAANTLNVVFTDLTSRSESTEAWIGLGNALRDAGSLDQATMAYSQAVSKAPANSRAAAHLGRMLFTRGQPLEAVRLFRIALERSPNDPQLHLDLGLSLHALGDYRSCWRELSWYHHCLGATWRHCDAPLWDGSPLCGRRLLLWVDETVSLTDTIYFARYASFVRASGGDAIVECHPALRPVLARIPHITRVVPHGRTSLDFDVHAPLRYFPALVHRSRGWSPPTARYLATDADDVRRWKSCLTPDGPANVGLVWRGDEDATTSRRPPLTASTFRCLARVPGVRLVSLQLGAHAYELSSPAATQLPISAVVPADCSLDRLATLVDALDLVIGVDSVPVHLAAALGKQTWAILSPGSVEWPWPAIGPSCLHYPSSSIFRRPWTSDSADLMNVLHSRLTDWRAGWMASQASDEAITHSPV